MEYKDLELIFNFIKNKGDFSQKYGGVDINVEKEIDEDLLTFLFMLINQEFIKNYERIKMQKKTLKLNFNIIDFILYYQTLLKCSN